MHAKTIGSQRRSMERDRADIIDFFEDLMRGENLVRALRGPGIFFYSADSASVAYLQRMIHDANRTVP